MRRLIKGMISCLIKMNDMTHCKGNNYRKFHFVLGHENPAAIVCNRWSRPPAGERASVKFFVTDQAVCCCVVAEKAGQDKKLDQAFPEQ